jgi:ADP-dependent phosphofructokinase/glucokinase
MWAKLWAFIDILKALLSLWREFKEQREIDQAKEKLKKRAEREKAIKDLENAKTSDELWDAQDRIVRNKP